MTGESETPSTTAPAGGTLRAYLELLRIPNVFTAAADVLMGYLVTHAALESPIQLWLLLAASCCLYLAGMVLNDVWDVEIDRVERPQRPIPSGRISLSAARLLGFELLLVGAAFGFAASYHAGTWRPAAIALALAACVVLYDGWAKRTPLGPLAMGGCRALNVLLGMSVAAESWTLVHGMIAGGIGVYIVGVTWFARTEARESSRLQLLFALCVIAAGIGLLAALPTQIDRVGWDLALPASTWYLFWALMALPILSRCFRAVIDPVPEVVQPAIKTCILSLIVLDAGACLARQGLDGPGLPWAILILALLAPTMLLGRWIYST